MAMDNSEVVKTAFAANAGALSLEKEQDPAVKEKEAVRRASNFALKLKEKMKLRIAARANGEGKP
jgi:hypothetical protein